MRQRLGEPMSHTSLARIALLSPFHFNRVFRQVTGIPPLQFLYALRIEAAKRLLVTTRRCITEICFDVGYNSLGTFTSRFTQLVGCSPRELRRLAAFPERFRLDLPCWPAGAPARQAGGAVHGQLTVHHSFDGRFFVALFPAPVPQGRPTGCAVLETGGPYHISSVPAGVYYACAVGVTHPFDPLHVLLGETALRGRSGPFVVRNGGTREGANIALRPVQLTDPPLLVSLPLLAAEAALKVDSPRVSRLRGMRAITQKNHLSR
jgi:AraC-like DNA-binding protein